LEPHGLDAYVLGLPKGERTFCLMEKFELAWPPLPGGPPVPPSARPKHDLERCYRDGLEVPSRGGS
jgi:hypothetical protein